MFVLCPHTIFPFATLLPTLSHTHTHTFMGFLTRENQSMFDIADNFIAILQHTLCFRVLAFVAITIKTNKNQHWQQRGYGIAYVYTNKHTQKSQPPHHHTIAGKVRRKMEDKHFRKFIFWVGIERTNRFYSNRKQTKPNWWKQRDSWTSNSTFTLRIASIGYLGKLVPMIIFTFCVIYLVISSKSISSITFHWIGTIIGVFTMIYRRDLLFYLPIFNQYFIRK